MPSLELRVPPPLVALAVAVLMGFVSWAFPVAMLRFAVPDLVAIALAGPGLVLALAGVLAFRRARTTIHPQRPEEASALVCSGVYRFTRNPMYLGLLLVLAGWGALLGSLPALLLLAAFVAWIDRFQIVPEERALQRKFGAAFEAYRRQVRRWV